jgi:hypothetical protein
MPRLFLPRNIEGGNGAAGAAAAAAAAAGAAEDATSSGERGCEKSACQGQEEQTAFQAARKRALVSCNSVN